MIEQNKTKEKKVYTIYDTIHAQITLEPMKCLHCGHIGEVVFNKKVADGYCQICGKWQLEEE